MLDLLMHFAVSGTIAARGCRSARLMDRTPGSSGAAAHGQEMRVRCPPDPLTTKCIPGAGAEPMTRERLLATEAVGRTGSSNLSTGATEKAATLVEEWHQEYFGLKLSDAALGELTRRLAASLQDAFDLGFRHAGGEISKEPVIRKIYR